MIILILTIYLAIGYVCASLLAHNEYKCGHEWVDFNFEYYMMLFGWLFTFLPVLILMGLIEGLEYLVINLNKVLLFPVKYFSKTKGHCHE